MDKQLPHYKRRLKDHHRERSEPVEFAEAPMYVLAANGGSEDSEPESLQPMIIAEMETKIPSLSGGKRKGLPASARARPADSDPS